MKLADDALIAVIEILRKGLIEQMDISQLLRDLDLFPDVNNKLSISNSEVKWSHVQNETD